MYYYTYASETESLIVPFYEFLTFISLYHIKKVSVQKFQPPAPSKLIRIYYWCVSEMIRSFDLKLSMTLILSPNPTPTTNLMKYTVILYLPISAYYRLTPLRF